MAVVPLRAPRGPVDEATRPPVEIEDDPQPDTNQITVSTDDDGLVTIEFGSDQPAAKTKSADRRFDRNLAEDMDDGALMALAAFLLEGIEADEGGRREWEDTANLAADYLGVKLRDPLAQPSGDGTICQTVTTCMLEAAVKLWSTAYAELLPAAGPVKVERADAVPTNALGASGGGLVSGGGPSGAIGGPPANGAGIGASGSGNPGMATPVPGGPEPSQPGQEPVTQGDEAGDDLAEALERDMNWYLTIGDRGYYPDTSKMLMHRDLVGLGFKEVYQCPIERKPVSRWIMAQDLIIQGDPPAINETDGRVTARKRLSQARMRRMQVTGHYLDVPLVHPTGDTNSTEIVIGQSQGVVATPSLPRDYEHTIFECNCELGSGTAHSLYGDLSVLDRDETGRKPGYPLPYRVTIDKDSRTIIRITRNWKRGDRDYKRKRRFVKYGFIPALGYYDWGLIHLVGNPTQAATMLERSAVDAALFANFPAWAMLQGPASKLENTVYRPGIGEVVKVPSSGASKISDVMMAWPYKEPSPQSMALKADLEGQVKRIVGLVDIPVGEGRVGNTPVGTIMSYIESVSMVPGAVHKADHVSQAEEFEMLRELMADEPECLTRGNRSPARQWQAAQEIMSPNLAPQADPNTPSQMHRLLKVQGQIMLGGLPQFMGIADNRAIYKSATEVLSGEDASHFTLPEQPPGAAPPDPKVIAAQIKAQTELQKEQGKQQEIAADHQAKMAELTVTSQDKAADRDAADKREAMKLGAAHMKTGADLLTAGVDHAAEAQQGAQQRQHEATQGAVQRQHDAQQGAVDRQHQAQQKAEDHAAAAEQQGTQQAHEQTMGSQENESE